MQLHGCMGCAFHRTLSSLLKAMDAVFKQECLQGTAVKCAASEAHVNCKDSFSCTACCAKVLPVQPYFGS